MGLRGEAAIVGYAEYPHERKYTGSRRFTIEQWADLTRLALEDAGLELVKTEGYTTSQTRAEKALLTARRRA